VEELVARFWRSIDTGEPLAPDLVRITFITVGALVGAGEEARTKRSQAVRFGGQREYDAARRIAETSADYIIKNHAR
jgi:hypothetical protein